ncbi:hypothetical protein ACFQ2Y_50935 [Streptomyces malaysiensis subsp. malaysiensis]|uniref:hypothetical protein n=1 Tax=Streptomyces TaxID=1883 RepID=UPI001E3DE970|nr:hypothetical protein [Streptomyces sp. HNM0561]UHH23889.1 hypothetical protein LUV23_47460 [Streptomyces sp. HNM0561]
MDETPAWALTATAGALLITLLVLAYLMVSRASARRAQLAQDRKDAIAQGQTLPPEPLRMDAKVVAGGVVTSLYGLWGFARTTLDLPELFALGFVSMFDILELRLFSLMYKAADPRKGWTPQLRLLQGTAWALVAASALANAAHAPNLVAAPFLAAMPVAAAWVIELDLRRALVGKEAEERPQGVKPGPLRLVGLMWRRLWAWGFRKAGLDVTDRADEMVRRARARDAADASYALRKALKEKDKLEDEVTGGQAPRGELKLKQKKLKTLEQDLEKKIRPKAQAALEMADTQDPAQGLQLMQRMAWLTRADDVALLDYGPQSPAMRVLEELNIAANAEFIESAQRAREEDQRAEQAAERAKEATRALEKAQAELEALSSRVEEAEKAEERETNRIRVLREEREQLEQSGSSAQQLYQRTVRELEDERTKVTDLEGERRKLNDTLSSVQTHLGDLEGEYKALQARVDGLADERDRLADEARQAGAAAREATEEAVRLQSRLTLFEELAGEETSRQLAGAVPAARAEGSPVVQSRVENSEDEASPGAKIAGFQLLEQQYLALPADERVSMSASALARQWWQDSGLTEQTTRKYIGDIKKMHDKADDSAQLTG